MQVARRAQALVAWVAVAAQRVRAADMAQLPQVFDLVVDAAMQDFGAQAIGLLGGQVQGGAIGMACRRGK